MKQQKLLHLLFPRDDTQEEEKPEPVFELPIGFSIESTPGKASILTVESRKGISLKSSKPDNPVTGDSYFNTTDSTLHVYDGNEWLKVARTK